MAVETLLAAEERQRLLAQFSEIAVLAGGLAHEIKNPLSTISLNLELLAEDVAGGDSPRDRRMLKKIVVLQRECRRLEAVLEDFLKFARVGELELVNCDLNQVVREFIEFYNTEAAANGVEISPHLAPDLPSVRLDSSLFRQVLLNLALNAQQAMPRGGTIEMQTRASAGRVELKIIDSGCGMDEKTLSRIFTAFFSTKPAGSGLGLATVKRIVEAHNGRVTVESAPSRGTSFTVSLPPAE
jgi:two-component system, NtrC family, sensor histidine kinase HydH